MYQNPTDAAGTSKPSRMQELGIRNADTAVDRLFLPGGHPDNSPRFQVSIYKKVSKSQERNLQNKSMTINTEARSHLHNKPNTRDWQEMFNENRLSLQLT